MEILTFDLVGKFAHFRKFHTNNTALSFTIPPRTALMGIVGAMLGKPRDSYYEDLSSDKLRFAIQVKSHIKKSFQRVNYLKIESEHDFRGKNLHVQTPVELVTGYHPVKDQVRYRIYVSHYKAGNVQFNELKDALLSGNLTYGLTLGTANHTASIENVQLISENNIAIHTIENDYVYLHSTCNSEGISHIQFEENEWEKLNFIEEELLPSDFKANYDREVVKMNRLVYTTGNMPLLVQLSGEIYKLTVGQETYNIQFME